MQKSFVSEVDFIQPLTLQTPKIYSPHYLSKNWKITGATGTGKSYLVESMLIDELLTNKAEHQPNITILTYYNEYKIFNRITNAKIYNLGRKDYKFNCLYVPLNQSMLSEEKRFFLKERIEKIIYNYKKMPDDVVDAVVHYVTRFVEENYPDFYKNDNLEGFVSVLSEKINTIYPFLSPSFSRDITFLDKNTICNYFYHIGNTPKIEYQEKLAKFLSNIIFKNEDKFNTIMPMLGIFYNDWKFTEKNLNQFHELVKSFRSGANNHRSISDVSEWDNQLETMKKELPELFYSTIIGKVMWTPEENKNISITLSSYKASSFEIESSRRLLDIISENRFEKKGRNIVVMDEYKDEKTLKELLEKQEDNLSIMIVTQLEQDYSTFESNHISCGKNKNDVESDNLGYKTNPKTGKINRNYFRLITLD